MSTAEEMEKLLHVYERKLDAISPKLTKTISALLKELEESRELECDCGAYWG